jgi:probable rRNA maturation factor
VLAFPVEDDPLPPGRFPDMGGTGPGSDVADEPPLLLGDVVVCPAVAERNAKERAIAYDDEIALLVVHGLLHLLGMDHVIDAEAEAMEALERTLLAAFYQGPS